MVQPYMGTGTSFCVPSEAVGLRPLQISIAIALVPSLSARDQEAASFRGAAVDHKWCREQKLCLELGSSGEPGTGSHAWSFQPWPVAERGSYEL